VANYSISDKSGRWCDLVLEQLLHAVVFKFQVEKEFLAGGDFFIQNKLNFFFFKWLFRSRMVVGFSRKVTQKQNENIFFYKQVNFWMWCKEPARHTWGAVEAEMSGGI
jgi:hypothetical protein